MKIVVLHEAIPDGANLDMVDTLVQIKNISNILQGLGHSIKTVEFSPYIHKSIDDIVSCEPDTIFNLVESVDGRTDLAYLAPMIIDSLGIPFTGCNTRAVFLTSSKILVKNTLKMGNIATPPWITGDRIRSSQFSGIQAEGPYIIKNSSEHASIGMDDNSVVYDIESLRNIFADKARDENSEFFAEAYIEGREFNISLLSFGNNPIVLAPQEICFIDYPGDKAKIITYDGKWDTDSFEYTHQKRRFNFHPREKPLLQSMSSIALKCWKVMGLSGYARIDFRVDKDNCPWVIDINTNPCISPDSSFVYAAQESGIEMKRLVKLILKDAILNKTKANTKPYSLEVNSQC